MWCLVVAGVVVEDPVEAYRLLLGFRVIAVVGASGRPGKPAHDVPAYLRSVGYRVVPVNPRYGELFGERAYPSLDDLPGEVAGEVDAVQVFRPPREALGVARAAARLAGRAGRGLVLWFQPGTDSEEAVEEAARSGLTVVRGLCMMELHKAFSRVKG